MIETNNREKRICSHQASIIMSVSEVWHIQEAVLVGCNETNSILSSETVVLSHPLL